MVLAVDAATFESTPTLLEEHFGPVAIIVRCSSDDELRRLAEVIPGGLTATVHSEPADAELVVSLCDALRERAGRLVFDGFPTGVAVTAAMHHGGPYPATTSALHTSVGTTAIRRFLRPVAYQDAPAALLPPALHDENPLGLRRLVDGAWCLN